MTLTISSCCGQANKLLHFKCRQVHLGVRRLVYPEVRTAAAFCDFRFVAIEAGEASSRALGNFAACLS